LPEAEKARGETAWAWALVTSLRNQPRARVETFLFRAETHQAKRPKLLCPVLRALLDNEPTEFQNRLSIYLSYYRKREFKLEFDKVLALDGSTLYHLGRKRSFDIRPPDEVAEHIIRFD
jgi:hypothetical protein